MALKHSTITPIPNNEPDAVPALWNTRYTEIDENFVDLDQRQSAAEQEITSAKGGKSSINARLALVESSVESLSPAFQDELSASIKYALDQAGVANRSVRALKQQIQQEGEVLIENRGVVSGCTVIKSITAARNLNLAAGVCFANGRGYSVASGDNMASVPSNISAGSASVVAYLYLAAAGWKMAVTAIGQAVPVGAIRIYNITIPAGSTDLTDPNLTNVTITSVRRVEVGYPQYLDSPVNQFVSINNLSANDYRVDIDVVSADGAPCDRKALNIVSRATNGFTFELASAADNVLVRYRISKLNN